MNNKKSVKIYKLSAVSIAMYAFFFSCNSANASNCESTRYGTIVINNKNNLSGCSVSSINGEIGGPYYDVGFYVYSQYTDQIRTLFVEKDIKTVLSGLVGITAFGANGASSFFNARDRNIDLTIKNATDDSSGVEVSFGSTVEIGTLNLHMENLPSTKKAWIFDIPLTAHYGVLAGSSLKAGEGKEYNEKYSRAIFDNLNITMSSYSDYSNAPIIAGIRAIQGAGKNSGIGSSGEVDVNKNLVIDLKAKKNDAIGIYVSGGDSQVNINNSSIKIESQSSRANAILIGKESAYGTGSGSLVSSGKMIVDTTGAKNSSAISIIWQGGSLDANKDSSRTMITSANSVISISGSKDSTGNSDTITSFNNLNASTTSKNANLIEVEKGQSHYIFNGRGSDGNLTSSTEGYLINVKGDKKSPSTVDFNYSEGKIIGLTNKNEYSTLNINLDKGATWQLAKKGSVTESTFTDLILNNKSKLNAFDVDNSNLENSDFKIIGNVTSYYGEIHLDNGKVGDKLTINGNYTGNNGYVYMNTTWNAQGDADGNNSSSDILNIIGTAKGETHVIPVSADGEIGIIDGNVKQVETIINTIPVVNVSDTSEDIAFVGNAQTTGATDVQLAKRTNDGKDEYYWTMKAQTSDPINPTPPEIDIYNPTVSGYVLMPRVNIDQVYASLNSLHIHHGENLIPAWNDRSNSDKKATGKSWGRFYGNKTRQDGENRLNLNTNIYGLQIGYDFGIKTNDNGSHSLAGAYISYSKANTNFFDDYRSKNGIIINDKYTGKGESEALGFGLTNTYYGKYDSYVDLIGQLSYLHNKYEAQNSANVSQNGWGTAFSIEAGHSFVLNNHKPEESGWILEPQAQLIYQYIDLSSFNDGVREVNQNVQQDLSGRVGVRFSRYSKGKGYQTGSLYAIANVWQKFLNPKKISIGGDNISDKYTSTWGEIGLGARLQIAKNTYIYLDARYEKNFGSIKREGAVGNLSFKYTWN